MLERSNVTSVAGKAMPDERLFTALLDRSNVLMAELEIAMLNALIVSGESNAKLLLERSRDWIYFGSVN